MSTGLKGLKSHGKIENAGEWFYPAEGVGFKLKRAGGLNKDYNKILAKLMKPHTQQYGKKQKEDDLDRLKLFGVACVKACLVDWEGFPEDPKPFTQELALEELLKDDWYDLLNSIADFAGNPDNFKGEVETQELGNS